MPSVNNIAKTSACQLSKTNIRVNSICPGIIEVRQYLDPVLEINTVIRRA